MRRSTRSCLFALALVAPPLFAQNLTNPGFETSWSTGSPPGWTVVTSQLTTTRNTTTKHSESASCFVKQNVNPTSTFQHFAKEWLVTQSSAIKADDWIVAKMRYYLPTTPALGAGQIYARATGINTATKVDVGIMQSNVLLVPSNSWQEVIVKYKVPVVTTQGITIRVGLRFQNVPKNVGVYLDTVYFQGTSKGFGTLLPPVPPTWVEPDYILQSNALTLKLDPYTGALKSLSETAGGFEYLATTPAVKPLYSLRTGDPGGSNHLIDSTHYSYNIIRTEFDTLTSTTTMTVDSGPALTGGSYFTETGAVSVGATIVAKSNAPELEFKVSAKNAYIDTSGYFDMIEEVQCPLLKLTPTLGASLGDDYVLLPGGDGSVTSGSGLRGLVGTSVTRDYPGNASCQLLAYADAARGLAVASLDTTGECKQFGFKYTDNAGTDQSVELIVKRRFPWTVNPTIATGYSVAVTPAAGDWSVAARWYRQKTASAPWRTSTYKTTNPSPAWLQERLPLYNFSYYEMGRGDWLCYPSDQRTVMDLWKPATTGVGSPMLVLARGCERYGNYILPVATPLKPDDTVVLNAWTDLKSSGHHVAVMMGGLKWAKSRAQYPVTPTYPVYPNPGCTCVSCDISGANGCQNCCQAYWVQPFVSTIVDNCNATHDVWTEAVCVNGRIVSIGTLGVRKKDGSLLVETPLATWDSEHGVMCPYLTDTRGIHADLALYLSNHGVDLYEFDQMNGGTIKGPCYATNHGHPAGYGTWIAQSVHSLFQDARVAGRGTAPGFINPNFAISIEDPGEFYVDVLDTYCGRLDQIEGQWPAANHIDSKVVPLFQMLYSDLVDGQALDNSVPTTWRTDGQAQSIVAIAREFTGWGHFACELKPWMLFGQYDDGVPGGISNAYWPKPDRVDLKAMTLMRNCVTTENGPAHSFFQDGRWVSTEGFAVPAYSYTDEAGLLHSVPAVSNGAWKLSNGQIGLVLAHCRNDAVLTSISTLPTGFDGVPVSPTAQVDVYVNGVLQGTFTPTTVPTCCFNPQDVAFLVYR